MSPRTRISPAAIGLPIALAAVLALAVPAAADTATFANNSPTTTPNQPGGQANPYPSTVTVSGLSGTVTKVTATLDISIPGRHNVDVMLAGPAGHNVLLMADANACSCLHSPATFTFDDAAPSKLAATAPSPSGTYQPTDYDGSGSDDFDAPAPTPPEDGGTLATFSGTAPNGQWSLYAMSVDGGGGQITSWSVTIETTGTPAGGGTPPPPPPPEAPAPSPPDETAPLASTSFPRIAFLGPALRRGLAGTISSNEAGTATAHAEIATRQARQFGLRGAQRRRPVVVARGRTRFASPGRQRVTLKFTRKARAKLRRARRVALVVRATVSDAAGNRTRLRRKVTLTR